MANYNYEFGKQRIEEILDSTLEVIEKDKIPKDENFTFKNAYYGWVTGIFVDIRDSSSLFSEEDKALVSKLIRSFTSEIIEILRKDENIREIGIRGDCVYAIYTTPYTSDIYEIVDKGIYINTFLDMLNALLKVRKLTTINAGIGISTAKELVVKAGRKDVGINNSVWIGDAVTKAANLSSLGKKDGYKRLLMSYVTFTNMIEHMCEKNPNKDVYSWFREFTKDDYGRFYDANVVKSTFNDWIKKGMPVN